MTLIDELTAIAPKITALEHRAILAEADTEAYKVRLADMKERAEEAERKLREADAGMWVFADDVVALSKRAEIAETTIATIAAALGKIAAPVEIVAEATAEVSEYPVETPAPISDDDDEPRLGRVIASVMFEKIAIYEICENEPNIVRAHEYDPPIGAYNHSSALYEKDSPKLPAVLLDLLENSMRANGGRAWIDHADAALWLALHDHQGDGFLGVVALYTKALEHGFPLKEGSVRKRMERLVRVYPQFIHETRSPKLAWKLKGETPPPTPKDDKPETVAPAPVDAGLADLKAAIEKVNGSKIGNDFKAGSPTPAPESKTKLYGRLTPTERIKRDRFLLEALGDEGRNFSEWSREITARGGDMGACPPQFLEAAQQRLKNDFISRNHFGGGATFKAWPTLAEALANLEGRK